MSHPFDVKIIRRGSTWRTFKARDVGEEIFMTYIKAAARLAYSDNTLRR